MAITILTLQKSDKIIKIPMPHTIIHSVVNTQHKIEYNYVKPIKHNYSINTIINVVFLLGIETANF